MAVLAPTNTPRRHVLGDLVVRHYTLSGNNGDTFTPPQGTIEFVVVTPTTAISVGVTTVGNTLTFVTSAAWAAVVAIFSRTG
jgi:hypothetical protein